MDLSSAMRKVILQGLRWGGMEYEDFVRSLMRALNYEVPLHDQRALIMSSEIRNLISIINTAPKPGNLRKEVGDIIRDLLRSVNVNIGYLVDNLGLPEIYGIMRIAQRSNRNVNLVVIKALINPKGNTMEFKEALNEDTMPKVAEDYGLQLVRGQDKAVHEVFSEYMDVNKLITEMKNKLLLNIAKIIKSDMERGLRILIIADHGYDIECLSGLCRYVTALNAGD